MEYTVDRMVSAGIVAPATPMKRGISLQRSACNFQESLGSTPSLYIWLPRLGVPGFLLVWSARRAFSYPLDFPEPAFYQYE